MIGLNNWKISGLCNIIGKGNAALFFILFLSSLFSCISLRYIMIYIHLCHSNYTTNCQFVHIILELSPFFILYKGKKKQTKKQNRNKKCGIKCAHLYFVWLSKCSSSKCSFQWLLLTLDILSSLLLVSPSYYVWGTLFIQQIFDTRFLADLHVLRSGESKNHKISMVSGCSLVR